MLTSFLWESNMGTNYAFAAHSVMAIVICAAFTGCSVSETRVAHLDSQRLPSSMIVGDPDFNWHLSGDRRVAPRQVFSDRGRIWLQWHPHQAVPSVFVEQAGGWRVVEHDEQGGYSVIEGPWRRLMFQGGILRAMAVYRPTGLSSQPCAAATDSSQPRYELKMADRTIRQALQRWSSQSNWFFDDTHWALPVDLPVTAPAAFSGNFEAAVADLLRSTRAAGESIKPCFYANHVLRVIPTAQSCDPMADNGDRP